MRNCKGHSGHGVEGERSAGGMVRSSQAIGPGVPAPDDDHALAGGKNLLRDFISRPALVLLRQKIHREMDAF
jgi:hypothetical protein